MKTRTFFIIACIGLSLILVLTLVPTLFRPSSPSSQAKYYAHDDYGVSFEYPDDYSISEAERGNGERSHWAITLIRKEDAGPRENSEGPTAITIDIYQNTLDEQSLIEWLYGSNASNFKLSDGTYESLLLSGRQAVRYRWSGLYEGETIALIHRDRIIAFSVTSILPEDHQQAFGALLSSLRLY